MIPELGHFALLLALCVAIIQTVIPLAGTARGNQAWIAVAVPAARAQMLLVSISLACLTWSFIQHDFSVAYVANNSNTQQPLMYRISAVWGAHEGSLLLWMWMLAGWGFAVSIFSRGLPVALVARVLAVLGAVAVGLYLFVVLTSDPFERLLPAVLEGRELNPLLQDPGLAIHPPMLYMGYVGLSVPFAFAIAALLEGKLDPAWVRWSRPWAVLAWVFLTLGIALGSWWAYYELGWGGWWFWDPVENASFMPWLVATALLHSLAVTEQRNAFRSWTLLLAIFGFSLSLLGTFLVRSGVLVSVHAFASDPARGKFILAFLFIVILSSLLLYAIRITRLEGGNTFEFMSRDTFLLVNNVLLVVASATILVGTLYPILMDALELGKISVGPPYFESTFVPLMLPLVFLMGVGPLVRWKQDSVGRVVRVLRLPLLISVLLASAFLWLASYQISIMVVAGIAISVWVVYTAVIGILDRLRNKQNRITALRELPRSFVGMTVAHIGVAVFVVGVTLTSAFSIEKDIRMDIGDSLTLADYTFTFKGANQARGPNYVARRGNMEVTHEGELVTILEPEKRDYVSQTMPMTEASIDAGLTRDLYVALGEPVANGAWSVRIYYKPYVQWIWLGPLIMGLGGLISISDRRYRLARRSRARKPGTSNRPVAATASGLA